MDVLIVWGLAGFFFFWLVYRMMRNKAVHDARRQAFQKEYHDVLTDNKYKVKGAYDE